jgi:hypothetical protein
MFHHRRSHVPGSARTQRQRHRRGDRLFDATAVNAEQRRLTDAGLASVDERGTTGCYARQDKFWVQGAPDGEPWEIYTVLADSQTFAGGSCG